MKAKIKEFREKLLAWLKKQKEERIKRSTVGMPVFRVGPNRKVIYGLWGLLAVSLIFAVYKNFTAIDKETIHEREVVEEKVKDTNRVESFVKQFALVFYTWGYDSASRDERVVQMAEYLTEELARIDNGTINSECPSASEVLAVNIWNVEEDGDGFYSVTYSVRQKLTEATNVTGEESIEGTELEEDTVSYNQVISENYYQTKVYKDSSDAMVIVKNPTIASAPEQSSYTPAEKKSDGTVSAAEQGEIEDFFKTFFALYPTATAKELAYYTSTDALGVINRNLVYNGILNESYYKEDGKINAHIYVQYLDQVSKATEVSEYTLVLEKGDNWKIVEVK